MSAKVYFRTMSLILLLAVVYLQNGCSVSKDAGEPRRNQEGVKLDLTTPGNVDTIVADGRDSVVIQLAVTNTAGAPRAGVQVAFATTAGTLTQAPAVPAAFTNMDNTRSGGTRQEGEAGEQEIDLVTNNNGTVAVLLTAPVVAGQAVVTADVLDFRTNIRIFFVAGPAAQVVLDLESTEVDAVASAPIAVLVTDANDNPVIGETVTFRFVTNESRATLDPDTAVTDATGMAMTTYTAGVVSGMDVVEAAVGGVASTVTITVDVVPPGGVAGVELTAPENTSVFADGESFVRLRATVTDQNGAGIPGIEVAFTRTAGRLVSPEGEPTRRAVTNPEGVATIDLIAGTNLGISIVTASAGGFISNPIEIMFIAGPPANLRLTANPTTVNVGQPTNLEATVTDVSGNPVAEATVTISVTENASGAASDIVAFGQTDDNGRFAAVYTPGNTPGTDIITAVVGDEIAGSVEIEVSMEAIPSGDVADITATPGAASVVADGTSRVGIRVFVEDETGQGLPGIAVSFTTTAGMLDVPDPAVTNSAGLLTAELIAATNLGTATVTASASGFSATAAVNFVAGASARVDLRATPTVVNANETANLVATVTDAFDNPVAGETLTFSLLEGPEASGATLSVLSGVTDANGRVMLTYTAGRATGEDTVQAEATNNISGTVRITVPPSDVVNSVELLVSSPQLDSDPVDTVRLTALVRDAANNVLEGIRVRFSADSGAITVLNDITGASGTAVAILTTGGDPTNRTIRVTARADAESDETTIEVSGTTVSISGTRALVLNQTRTLTILVRDAAGNGIPNATVVVTSRLGNPLTTPLPTDTIGQTTVEVTALNSGTDTIIAAALNAEEAVFVTSPDFQLEISPDNFVIEVPGSGARIRINRNRRITLHWDIAGDNVTDAPINFFATRGQLSASNAITNADGDASVLVSSATAGPAIITAVAAANGGPATQVEVTFVADNPHLLILQASPTTLGVNREGDEQQSLITAIVRDPDGNVVQGQIVAFSLFDTTGGRLTSPFGTTDDFGRASTVYVSSNTASRQDGVVITASVGDAIANGCDPAAAVPNGPCDQVTLTVAGEGLFITLGTGNSIDTSVSPTQYAIPYAVLVTDANGNPVEGAQIEANILPTRYQKGRYERFFDAEGMCQGWGKILSVNIDGNSADPDDIDQACDSEDVNQNGILDRNPANPNESEDRNNNGLLDPEVVATVVGNLVTDETGFVNFDVVYFRDSTWVEVLLEVRATVVGSEGFSRATFFLAGAAEDFLNCDVAPPGRLSPYGVAARCSCDERVDSTCPVSSPASPVIINVTAGDTTFSREGGGEVEFVVVGGTNTAHIILTDVGTLVDAETRQPIANPVPSGRRVVLVVRPNLSFDAAITFIPITVTAIDSITGQRGQLLGRQNTSPPVNIIPTAFLLPVGGGTTLPFQLNGGSQSSYTVTTTAGTLRNLTTEEEGSFLGVVNFGEAFILITDASEDGLTISITATDRETGQESSAEVRQLAPNAITINPPTSSLSAGGGFLDFTVGGGSQIAYTITTTTGELSRLTEDPVPDACTQLGLTQNSGRVICISADEIFRLTTDGSNDGDTILLIARDAVAPAPEGVAMVTQQPSDPVVLFPAESQLPPEGGDLSFTVGGGSRTSYTVTTTAGTLTNLVTNQTGIRINVQFNEGISLTTDFRNAGGTITITAIDDSSGASATATVQQQALNAVSITPINTPLPAGGGTVEFTVSGGSQTSYTVTTTAGTLRLEATDPGDTAIIVPFGDTFTLTTDASVNGQTILITAIDRENEEAGTATATVVQQRPVPASITLLVSGNQLDSNGTETITLTALVRDADSRAVEGVTVSFRADSGLIIVNRSMTDANGTATAILGTGGDPRNRNIVVTASTAGVNPPASITIRVTGTTVTITGPNSVVLGESRDLSILVRDSGGRGIPNQVVRIESANLLSDALSPCPPEVPREADEILVCTALNGQASVTVTANVPGLDTITATAISLTADGAAPAATLALNVSAANFVFSQPDPDVIPQDRLVELRPDCENPASPIEENIVVHWDEQGTPVVGARINLTTTRGRLSESFGVTNANGDVTGITICSTTAGLAIITATADVSAVPVGEEPPSAQVAIVFAARFPATMIVQADPTTLGINVGGVTDQQSIITAVVRDEDNNLVQGAVVSFSLTDNTGGTIFPASDVTNELGRASTVYTAGASVSAEDGVVIRAEITRLRDGTTIDPPITGEARLTVAQRSLFVTLGTGNSIFELDPTTYDFPYSVLVTDASGNPVSGATVELNVDATRYQKGVYELRFSGDACLGWFKTLSINPANGGDDIDQACENEDVNDNGILDLDEIDVNNNGQLDPDRRATVPVSVVTDSTGFGFFNVSYAQELTWLEVELEARATVEGSEAVNRARFFLPGSAADFNDCTVPPPGLISPFGTADTCLCDDRAVPCP